MQTLLKKCVVALMCSTLALSGCGSGVGEMVGVASNDQAAATATSPFEFKSLDPQEVDRLAAALAAQIEGLADTPSGTSEVVDTANLVNAVLADARLEPGSAEIDSPADGSSGVRQKAAAESCVYTSTVRLSKIRPGNHSLAWSSIKARHAATRGDLWLFSKPGQGTYIKQSLVNGTVTLNDANQTITLRHVVPISCAQFNATLAAGPNPNVNTTWREFVGAAVGTLVSVTITATATIVSFAAGGFTAGVVAAVASCFGGVAGTFVTAKVSGTPITKETVAQAAASCVINAGGSALGRGIAAGLTAAVRALTGSVAAYIPQAVEAVELTVQRLPRAS